MPLERLRPNLGILAKLQQQQTDALPGVLMVYCKRLAIVFVLLCVIPIATLAQKVATDHSPPPPPGKLVDVGGYRVHLFCTGTGSPTVVIVGAGYSFDWGLVQPEVARFTQVC